jgi:hypothetical protein
MTECHFPRAYLMSSDAAGPNATPPSDLHLLLALLRPSSVVLRCLVLPRYGHGQDRSDPCRQLVGAAAAVGCTASLIVQVESTAGLAINPVQGFRTGLPLHWEFLRLWTGFELPSSWPDLPCDGLNLNRNILDFMRWPQIDLGAQDLNDIQRPKSFSTNSWK